MATIGANVMNIVDVVKGFDPDGRISKVAEILNQKNEVLLDMPWREANTAIGDQITVRTGLPTPTWRRMNKGVTPGKSRKDQIVEAIAKMEDLSEVDEAVAEIGGDPAGVRLSEAKAHIEGINQAFTSNLFYGTAVNPERFVGLSARYGSLSAGNSQNIINMGGTGSDNTSVWLIVWSDETLSGIYPKGSRGGLQHNDKGKQLITETTGAGGSKYFAYIDQFIWDCGIAQKDWRFAARICNIDVSDMVGAATPADLTNAMISAIGVIPSLNVGRAAFYMNRTSYVQLAKQRRADVRSGGQLTYEVVDGKMTPFFMEIPIRKVDQILNTESVVS
jgi:hypothetical protein